MKKFIVLTALAIFILTSPRLSAQSTASKDTSTATQNLYIDVHHLGPGKVKFEDVAKAHAKDLAVEKKYGVHFINYWVDEADGNVYCLSTAADSQSIRKTHATAHGMLPDQIFLV
jgi:hypothetical protein